MNRMRTKQTLTALTWWLLSLIALGLNACNGPTSTDQTHNTPVDVDPQDYPALQSKLISLVTAQDRAQQAGALKLGYEDGRVQIVIDSEDAAAADDLAQVVEALEGRIEAKTGNLIQAWVPVDALLKLARHPRVLFIRTPVKP